VAEKPAAVVCDVAMPDMDGYRPARQMKPTAATATVPRARIGIEIQSA